MPPKKAIIKENQIILESDSDDDPKPIKKTNKKKLNVQEEPIQVNQVNQVDLDYGENLTEDDFKEILKSHIKDNLEELSNALILLEQRKDEGFIRRMLDRRE